MAAVDSFQFLYREISRSCTSYFETLALVGALYAASRAALLLRDCCSLVRVHFLPRMIPNHQRLRLRYGDWAVIYGAAEPVAQAYAEELAKHGVSILFVTQDEEEEWVRAAAASLAQNHNVETAVVPADFSRDPSASKPVLEAVRGKDVGFLVTCVDAALASPLSLVETPEGSLADSLNRNVGAVALMTRLVLPGMVERGRGALVVMSSGLAGRRPLPGRVALAAATGFLDHFSRALHLEYGSRGIFVQSLTPLQIAPCRRPPSTSAWTSYGGDGWLVPSPEIYARHALSTLGVSNRTTGYWPHTLQGGVMRCIPEWIWVLGTRLFVS